jgi:pyruvate-ferredoxin/flavodoxin oxidoreductase
MVMANATGCSSIWGGSAPANPYTCTAEGYGPAWANSLFEDNAQFGFGIAQGLKQRRDALAAAATVLVEQGGATPDVRAALGEWLLTKDNGAAAGTAAKAVIAALKAAGGDGRLATTDSTTVQGALAYLRVGTGLLKS